MKLHKILFHVFLLIIPIQTRVLYSPEKAYINWYFDYHLGFFLYLTDILLFTSFAVWLLFDPPNFEDLVKNKHFLLFVVFLGLCLVTLFHVKQVDLGLYQTLKWLEFLFILLYIRLTFKNIRDFEIGMLVVFISAVLQSILGWIQFHVQHMLGLKFLGEYISTIGTPGLANIQTAAGKIIRAYGTMPHPNVLAGFQIFGLVSGLYCVARETLDRVRGIWYRFFAYLGFVILLVGIFTTFSRLAWAVAALAILAYVGYYLWTNRKSVTLTIFFLCLVSGAIIFTLYPQTLKARISDSNNVSVEDRYFFNDLGWDMFKRFPSLGVGVGNYVPALQELYQLEPWQHQPAHNIFIFLAAELGILGASLFIIILFEIFSGLKGIVWDILPFSLTVIGILFLFMGQFDHYFVTIQQGRLMFATVLGLVAALPNIYKNPNDQIHNIRI